MIHKPKQYSDFSSMIEDNTQHNSEDQAIEVIEDRLAETSLCDEPEFDSFYENSTGCPIRSYSSIFLRSKIEDCESDEKEEAEQNEGSNIAELSDANGSTREMEQTVESSEEMAKFAQKIMQRQRLKKLREAQKVEEGVGDEMPSLQKKPLIFLMRRSGN